MIIDMSGGGQVGENDEIDIGKKRYREKENGHLALFLAYFWNKKLKSFDNSLKLSAPTQTHT